MSEKQALIGFSTTGKYWSPIFLHVIWVVSFFAFIYILLFSSVLFGGRLLVPYDGMVYSLPAFSSSHHLWSNLIYSGFPKAADPQAQIWCPGVAERVMPDFSIMRYLPPNPQDTIIALAVVQV